VKDRGRDVDLLRRILGVSVVALLGGCGGDSGAGESGVTRVGVVIKGLDNPFFGAMKQGVTTAAHDLRAEVRVSAATGLADTAGQAS
jgi:ABC-type sugar transport system substrate-binding protein